MPFVAGVESFGSLGAATPHLAEMWPELVLVAGDLGSSELESLLLRRPPHAHVLILIRSADPANLAQATRLQAQGFLMEDEISFRSLESALMDVLDGELPMPAALAGELLNQARSGSRPVDRRPLLLTNREAEVLGLLIDGLSNKQIARKLGISPHGAKRHVANVLMKLNCPNRTMAVARAITEGLTGRP
jgi:DNA-binding NarL/FixJ family response regulator